MVPHSSLNSGAINDYRNGQLPMISLQDIGVSKFMPEAKQLVKESGPIKMVTDVHVTEPVDIPSEDDEYDCLDQESFMKFFGLSSTREVIESVQNLERFRQRLNVNPTSYVKHDICDVDLTSNLGALMRNNSLNMCTPNESSRSLIGKYDAYCQATTRRLGNWDALRKVNTNYVVTYPMSKRQGGTHLYVFNRRQRLQQFRRLQTGLTKRSRRLVKWCKDCSVKLTRLTDSQIRNCCRNVNLEPTLHSVNSADVLVIENMVTVENSFTCADMDLCIDGTVVIEIDEFGSETVKVSQKPSKQINHRTGNLWLSPKKVSILNPLQQYNNRRPVAKSLLRTDTFKGVLPHVTISPVMNIKREEGDGNLRKPPVEVIPFRNNSACESASNGDSTEPEIEFLGSVLKRENVTHSILHKLASKSPVNGEQFNTISHTHFDPLNFVRATYHADSSKPPSLGTHPWLPSKPSLTDRISILRRQPCRSYVKPENHRDQSVEAILKRNSQISVFPYPRKSSVACSPPRLQEYSPARAQCRSEDEDCLTLWRRKEAELNLISSLIGLGDGPDKMSLAPSASGLKRNCILKCHICDFEQQFDTNAIGCIYDHMSIHGDLSLSSLVSHLEDHQGIDVVVLQAFPLNVV